MAQNVEERGLVPGEVLQLLDERGRVQSWVEKLADLESEASPAVYDKVLTDYRERLTGLSERLASHRGAVQTSLDEVRERLARLAQERAERVAALEEAKLRYTVGEFADKEWERHRETDGQAVAELEESLGVENEARQELERILSELPDPSGRQRPVWMPSYDDTDIPPRSPDEQEEVEEADEGVAAAAVAAPAAAYVVEPGDEDAVAPEEEAEVEASETATEPAGEATIETEELAARSADAGDDAGKAEALDTTEAAGGLAGLAEAEGEAGVSGLRTKDASHLDELAFLESLTLDDTERFDAVSAMLEEGDEKGQDEEEERPH